MPKMSAELKKRIKKYLKDFEKSQPANVEIDGDTFEGEAYYIMHAVMIECA